MSTLITIHIHDELEHTWHKNPNRKAGDPFPNLPGPDLPAHSPFDLVLEWSRLPGTDPWQIKMPGLLPVTTGVWEVIGVGVSPFHSLGYVSIKTSKGDGAKEFMALTPPWPRSFGNTWPSVPIEKGSGGRGYFNRNVGGGTLNTQFLWQCTNVI